MYAIQLLCSFDEIRIIFEALTIAIFQLCLLPKMRLSVDLEGRFTGYYTLNLAGFVTVFRIITASVPSKYNKG